MPLPDAAIATPEAIAEWSLFAGELADSARKTTTRYFRTLVPQEVKSDATPVTLADRETEAALRDLIKSRYPEHGIYGEEFGLENPSARLRWVIDPIDGTRPFLAGIPTYVTLISLTLDGVPIIGVIDQPVVKERWLGAYGQPTIHPEPALPSHTLPRTLEQAMIGTSDPTLFSAEASTAYQRLRAACSHQICGGDGYLYGRLASGALHVVCEFGLKAHDFAALIPVIENAGGVITDWQGKPLTIDSAGDVLASASADLHAQALAALNA